MVDDVKDLIEIAKQEAPAEQTIAIHPDVQQFIIDTGMVDDPKGQVNLKWIHWTYVKWCKVRDKEPMTNTMFGKNLCKKFKKIHSFRRWTYFVNKEPYHVDDMEIFVMNRYYREKKEYGKKAALKRQASRAKKAIQQQS